MAILGKANNEVGPHWKERSWARLYYRDLKHSDILFYMWQVGLYHTWQTGSKQFSVRLAKYFPFKSNEIQPNQIISTFWYRKLRKFWVFPPQLKTHLYQTLSHVAFLWLLVPNAPSQRNRRRFSSIAPYKKTHRVSCGAFFVFSGVVPLQSSLGPFVLVRNHSFHLQGLLVMRM